MPKFPSKNGPEFLCFLTASKNMPKTKFTRLHHKSGGYSWIWAMSIYEALTHHHILFYHCWFIVALLHCLSICRIVFCFFFTWYVTKPYGLSSRTIFTRRHFSRRRQHLSLIHVIQMVFFLLLMADFMACFKCVKFDQITIYSISSGDKMFPHCQKTKTKK